MALGVAGIIASVESHAEQLGIFERVNTSEAKSPPGKGLSCAIWADQISPDVGGSGLAVVAVRVTLIVRIYKPMLSQPYGDIDKDILTAVDTLMAAYSGAFTLEGQLKAIDLLGQAGTTMSARAGYVTIDKQMFRTVDITLPLLTSDLWNEVP